VVFLADGRYSGELADPSSAQILDHLKSLGD